MERPRVTTETVMTGAEASYPVYPAVVILLKNGQILFHLRPLSKMNEIMQSDFVDIADSDTYYADQKEGKIFPIEAAGVTF